MKERVLYLHVGMDKTGTSAIQWFLYKNRDRLEKQFDIYYPKTGLWTDFSHHPFAFSIFNINGYLEKDLTQLQTELTKEISQKNKVILSSECLLRATTTKRFGEFKTFLLNNFDEIKVIVYVRRQDIWVESRYKHSIISGSEINLKKLQSSHFCDYKSIIDKWTEHVGLDNVIVKPYEKTQFVDNNIFSDFLSIFDVQLTDKYKLPTSKINTSLSINASEFKRICNYLQNFKGDIDEVNRVLLSYSQLENEFSYNKYYLTYEERVELVNRYEQSNRLIANEYLGREDGILFYNKPQISDQPKEKYEGLTKNKILEIATYIYRKKRNLFKDIVKSVSLNLESDNVQAQYAAKTLSPILDINCE